MLGVVCKSDECDGLRRHSSFGDVHHEVLLDLPTFSRVMIAGLDNNILASHILKANTHIVLLTTCKIVFE